VKGEIEMLSEDYDKECEISDLEFTSDEKDVLEYPFDAENSKDSNSKTRTLSTVNSDSKAQIGFSDTNKDVLGPVPDSDYFNYPARGETWVFESQRPKMRECTRSPGLLAILTVGTPEQELRLVSLPSLSRKYFNVNSIKKPQLSI